LSPPPCIVLQQLMSASPAAVGAGAGGAVPRESTPSTSTSTSTSTTAAGPFASARKSAPPPPKPVNVFSSDGSFLQRFKKQNEEATKEKQKQEEALARSVQVSCSLSLPWGAALDSSFKASYSRTCSTVVAECSMLTPAHSPSLPLSPLSSR
jgi:hypothetical protein